MLLFNFKNLSRPQILHMKGHALQLINAIVLALLVFCIYSQECQLEDSQFFVTFHPHLDAFWLNTDDQLKNQQFRPAGFLYNMNQRNSKQIFNSMLQALQQNNTRKYFISEIVFFKDWYDYLTSDRKQQVKKMLKNGQIDIANSGWVQNDEAVCYYDDILDQYTIGMNWMYEQFGYVNKIGWATDSFGHSHSQVALQHLLGFEFQGIQRVDDRYIYQRKDHPLLQFYWQPVSASNNKKYGGLLNQVRHFLHQVNDLRRSSDRAIASDFTQLQTNMEKLYKKSKLFRFLGNDFEEFVPGQFSSLESAMQVLNKENSKSKCPKFKYGNPQDYLTSVKLYWSRHELQTRLHDFMPNWDQDRYWTGYYTTDPQLKYICKYFSRLLNLAKKQAVIAQFSDPQTYESTIKILTKAEQLNAVMQHHDGITATSKAHIETLFKDRMRNSSKQLVNMLQNLGSYGAIQTCQFFKESNKCKLTQKQPKLNLMVLHRGALKKETLELQLPQDYIYTIKNRQCYIVQSQPGSDQKKLVFEAQLLPGKNVFALLGQQRSNYQTQIPQFQETGRGQFQQEGIRVKLQNNQIQYGFGQNYMHFSYHFSANTPSHRKTVAWNKYGNRNDKTQSVSPGIYIMSNNGKLDNMNIAFHKLFVLKAGNRRIFVVEADKVSVRLVIQKQNPAHLVYKFDFSPTDRSYKDYFLKIDSNIKNNNDQFFHDSNGYLVSKRKIGFRPDYQWDYKPQDKINANTYPACSFFYLQNDQHQKFVAFLDRAQGVSTFDGSMLINIDRLAQDDYKGVGEAYTFVRKNTFVYKFAITSVEDDLQRIWQRQYDEALLGFVTDQQILKESQHLRKTPQESLKYIKYTLSFLNSNQILIRLQNMAERSQLRLPTYKTTDWQIPQLSLNMTFKDIRQSFANGIVFKERYNWIGDEEEINSFTRTIGDTKNQLLLRPLEIRSFRLNLNGKIEDKESRFSQSSHLTSEKVRKIQMIDSQPVFKHSLRKRCF